MPRYIKPETDFLKRSEWLAYYLIREGYHLDYTIESLSEIDRLFEAGIELVFSGEDDDYSKAISAYIGHVFILNYKSKWDIKFDDNNEIDYKKTSIVFKNKYELNPFSIVTSLIRCDYKLTEYIKGIGK